MRWREREREERTNTGRTSSQRCSLRTDVSDRRGEEESELSTEMYYTHGHSISDYK